MTQPQTPRSGAAGGAGSASHADFSRPGAIDLSQIAAQQPAQDADAPATGTGNYTVEVTEAELNDVIQQSLNYPVILALLSGADPGCQQLSTTLNRLADQAAGRWLLATVNVDNEPRIAQALRVQAVPTVIALIAGQALPLFQGTADESQIRDVLEQVMSSAVANGIAGRVTPHKRAEDAGPDPRFAAADKAMMDGDYQGAIAEFDKLLKANPKDSEAASGKATATMLARSAEVDSSAAIAAADADPSDIDKAFDAADAQIIAGQAPQAFDRLIGLIRTTAGDDRDRIRQRVLELFETMDPADPELLAARRALGSALY